MDHRYAVNQDDHVVTVMAVVCVDPQLVDHLEGVFAPVLDIDQRVVQRRAVIAREAIAVAQDAGRREDIRRDDFFKEALELALRQLDAVERLKLVPKIEFKRGTVANVFTMLVFQAAQLADEAFFN